MRLTTPKEPSESKRRLGLVFRTRAIVGVILAAGTLAAFDLNRKNNDFPVYYHWDEVKKVSQIRDGWQDFHHPLLMLQLNRWILGTDPARPLEKVAIRARTVSAALGASVLVLSFGLARCVLAGHLALWGALAAAFSPIVVVHSHYVKEDIYMLPFLLLSMLFYFRLAQKRSIPNIILLGLFTGLACSAKYAAAVLVPIYFLAPVWSRQAEAKPPYAGLAVAVLVATAVFLLVNYPLLSDFASFRAGLTYEIQHVVKGHFDGTLKRNAPDHYFLYHFLNSITAGTNYVFAPLMVLGLLFCPAAASKNGFFMRFFGLFFLTYYLVIELSPNKPVDGAMRYALPLIPVGFILLFNLMEVVLRAKPRLLQLLVLIVMFAGSVYMLSDTALVVYHLNRDTRQRASRWMEEHPGKAAFGRQAIHRPTQTYGASELGCRYRHLASRGYRYVVLSEFAWQRTGYPTGAVSGDLASIQLVNNCLDDLFSCPTVEIKPEHRRIAYSNPTVRIVDIKGCNQYETGAMSIDPDHRRIFQSTPSWK